MGGAAPSAEPSLATGTSPDDAERPASGAAKKRRRKAKKKQGLAEGAEVPGPDADADELAAWAASRLSSTWAAEVRALSLSPLEAKEFRPVSAWFMPLAPGEKLRRLPRML